MNVTQPPSAKTHANPRIGVVVANRGHETAAVLRDYIARGFESFEIAFKNTLAGTDLARLADEIAAVLAGTDATISCLGIYGNSLAENEHGAEIRAVWHEMIRLAPRFGTDLVCGFTGRVTGATIPQSIPRFAEVFHPMAELAGESGVRLAFENCLQGGTWDTGDRNLAHNPAAWELMFTAVPAPNIGLEWEPAHQICQLIDPVPQLEDWAARIFHVHGKDAQMRPDLLAKYGAYGAKRFAWHRFPGLGQSHWAQLISALVAAGYAGNIDIEGGHDPVYRGERELSGQLLALEHLKRCRAPY
jgi:sugar phosphate isomerase/epimerase